MKHLLPALAGLLLLVGVGGCGGQVAAGDRALVFAAASLRSAFEELGERFAATHPGQQIAVHTAGTPRLVLQLEQGAPADVFASADEANMARAVATGRVRNVAVFTANRLAILVPGGNPRGLSSLRDLAAPGLRVLYCGPEVPAGRYARQAMAGAGLQIRGLSEAPSVAAVATKVGLGEVDAGIGYVTDARPGVDAVPLDPESNGFGDLGIRYPMGLVEGGDGGDVGRAFMAFVRSPEGQGILARHGFVAP